MPSLSVAVEGLCQHKEMRPGCVACSAFDLTQEHKEACEQTAKFEEAVKNYDDDLSRGGMPDDERQSCLSKRERAGKQLEAWQERVALLTTATESLAQEVEALCAANDASALPKVFEEGAQARLDGFERNWRAIVMDFTDKNSKDASELFRRADPTRELSFQALDRSEVPATPDYLVNDGHGFEVFLRHGFEKGQKQRLPLHAVGDKPDGEAIMSYGSALSMFGTPVGPGTDSEPNTESSAEDGNAPGEESVASGEENAAHTEEGLEPLTASIEQCKLVTDARTEHDRRRQEDYPTPTEPALDSKDQWALFGPKHVLRWAAMLTHQYAKLAKKKAQQEAQEAQESTEGEPSGDNPEVDGDVAQGSTDAVSTDNDGWPSAQGIDWAGFTNWIQACKQRDSSFYGTVASWKAQRDDRIKAVAAKLMAWKPPADFDDGSASYPLPSQFYEHPVKVGTLDKRILGFKD